MGYEFGLSRRIYGVVYGVVTDNKHPEGDYRVKVKLPWIRSTDAGDDEDYISSWARIISPMASSGYGFYNLPEVGDEVVLSFVHGDIRQPVVLGSVFNPKENKMPVGDDASKHKELKDPAGNDIGIHKAAVDNNSAGGKNNARFIQTRSGHCLIFDDTEGSESITLFSSSGHAITLNDEKKNIVIQDSSGEDYLLFDHDKGKITLETENGDIDVLCKNGTFNLEAKEITTKSTTTATHEATNEMTHKSKSVVINGSSQVDVDGGTIYLN